MSDSPRVDDGFVEKFMKSVNTPLEYGVYFLFHDYWGKAPQSAIDAYVAELHKIPGIEQALEERYIAEPLSLERLKQCAPGTLGAGYLKFIVDNNLEANLGKNYRQFNDELRAAGTLDRLPDDLSYMMVRGFQTHDFHHVLTGYEASIYGELALAAYYLAQLRQPYHAFRVAVTTAHTAFLAPAFITEGMDAFTDGWSFGRMSKNIYFERWEDEIDTPLEVLRDRFNLNRHAQAA
ncbi:MAG: Coq4 family protein [Candidatus Phaeomarinobacter sp.]